MTTIADKLQTVRARIDTACRQHGRDPQSVQLLAVSKTFDADAVREAHAAGQTAFGENYVQEAVDKIRSLSDLALEWHCIGPLQSNKTRLVATYFDWVHSIDRLSIAQRLSAQRPSGLPDLQVCVQVNVDGGLTKSGVAPQTVADLAHALRALPGIRLRGLMTIPDLSDDPAQTLAIHQQTKALFDTLNQQGFALDTLSMGMSADLEPAIQAGSTMVRVGTAIFGTRAYPA